MVDKIDFGPRLGADPELFVGNSQGIVPVCGLIGGNKENPIQVNKPHLLQPRDSIGNFAYQEDGVAYEFNVPAVTTYEQFTRNLHMMLELVDYQLAMKNLIRRPESHHKFRPIDLVNPLSRVIGCLSDNSAWGEGDGKREPFTADSLGDYRFCGGHLHVQYNYNNVPKKIFVQFMDLFAGLPSIRWDKQGERRKFYGQPGIFRDKPYGIEYRTLSNFWLKSSFMREGLHRLCASVFDLAELSNNNPESLEEAYTKIPWADVRRAIETEDGALARNILKYVSEEGFRVSNALNLVNMPNRQDSLKELDNV